MGYPATAVDHLSDKAWRLDNLYYIQDKKGDKVKFKMNVAQRYLLDNMWYLNIILKARQRGFTTFIDLYILDECIFNSEVEAGIIAHTMDDAKKIFRRKIQYPYDHLPQEIKDQVYPDGSDSKTEMKWSNGSVVSVGASMRSGTLQYLHISEFGKICAKFPEKAQEIVTGSLETVAVGQIIWIESTAEGRQGYFFDYCKEAQNLQLEEIPLTEMDYKFHFFPWFEDEGYRLKAYHRVNVTKEYADYFKDLKRKYNINLDAEQKAWYIKKANKLGDDMKREYPSTPEEAFEAAIRGAYYSKEISKIRGRKQICRVMHDESLPVHTSWDLGMNDTTAIWFFQYYGNQFRFIDYEEDNGESLQHWARVLRGQAEGMEAKKKYLYGKHLLPHDAAVREMGNDGKKRSQVLEELGFAVTLVQRVQHLNKRGEGIDAVRRLLPMCWIDTVNCDQGIKSLEAYQKEWDEAKGCFRDRPLHNWASNGADAFRQVAQQAAAGFDWQLASDDAYEDMVVEADY